VISGVLQNASWFVTDRLDGDSQEAFAFNNLAVHVGDDPTRVAANRAALAARVGCPVVFTRAAHSASCRYVAEAGPDIRGVDALITDVPGLALAAQGADCAMTVVAAGNWVAAIHCGWKGLVAGIVPATLAALDARGADLDAAQAHLGPAICAGCYQVDPQRLAAVADVTPEAVRGQGVDVRAGVVAQLRAQGISATVDSRCTFEDPDLYSYRRDSRTGRQAIVIVREPA
jgi:YfiH family protein